MGYSVSLVVVAFVYVCVLGQHGAFAETCSSGGVQPTCRAPDLFKDAKVTTWTGQGGGRWNSTADWSNGVPCNGIAVLPAAVCLASPARAR